MLETVLRYLLKHLLPCFAFFTQSVAQNNTKTISVAVVLVSVLVETSNKLNNSILWLGTVMRACGWVHTCLIMCASKLHSCRELRRWGWNTVPWLWSSKTCFPEHFFFPPPLVFTHPFPLWVRAVWLLFWKWSTETLAEQGEQTAHMPCGFLTPYFSALGFWRATQRLHSWQLIEQMQVSIRTIWTCNKISVCGEPLDWRITRSCLVFCFIAVGTLKKMAKKTNDHRLLLV